MSREEKHNQLSDYINNNYDQIIKIARSISKEYDVLDLVSESVLRLYTYNINEEVFKKEILNFYIYRTIQTTFFLSKNNKKEYTDFNFTLDYVEDDSISEENLIEQYKKDTIYPQVFSDVNLLMNSYQITRHDGILFILYYFPKHSKDYIEISNSNYLKLINKQSYRILEEITNIDYQTCRNSVLLVLNKLKKYFYNEEN